MPVEIQAPPRFHLLAKPSGSTCNIDCTYCFFLSKEALYPNSKSRMSDQTLEICRLAADTCIWPLYEVDHGEFKLLYRPKEKLPIEAYLEKQRRFAHLFKDESGRDEIAKIQAIADHNVERYGLARRT